MKKYTKGFTMGGLVLGLVFGSVVLAQDATPKIKKVPVSQTSASSGKEMYHSYCASCHGVDGTGNGPAAPALKKAPTNLTQLAQKNGGKFPTDRIQASLKDNYDAPHGSKDMPVWGPLFSSVSAENTAMVQLRIKNVTDYIGTLHK